MGEVCDCAGRVLRRGMAEEELPKKKNGNADPFGRAHVFRKKRDDAGRFAGGEVVGNFFFDEMR